MCSCHCAYLLKQIIGKTDTNLQINISNNNGAQEIFDACYAYCFNLCAYCKYLLDKLINILRLMKMVNYKLIICIHVLDVTQIQ